MACQGCGQARSARRGRPVGEPRKRRLVVPWQPRGGVVGDLDVVALQRDQVFKRILAVELGGVDQAHEDVADMGAVLRLEEHGVLAVQDGLLQCPLADIVIQRSSGHTQEQGQGLPVLRTGDSIAVVITELWLRIPQRTCTTCDSC